MDKFIVVIGRQFGCGGRKIGKQIAEALGVPYYDKTLLSEVAQELGFDKAIFDKADEKRPSFLRSLLQLNYGATAAALQPGTLSNENLYKAQSEAIKSICNRGSCVIVGRTADYIMRENPGLISIFIKAPIEVRAQEIVNRNDAQSLQQAEELARKADKDRESYYNYFTNRSWGSADNYDFCFDSSKFSIPFIIDFIKNYIENHD